MIQISQLYLLIEWTLNIKYMSVNYSAFVSHKISSSLLGSKRASISLFSHNSLHHLRPRSHVSAGGPFALPKKSPFSSLIPHGKASISGTYVNILYLHTSSPVTGSNIFAIFHHYCEFASCSAACDTGSLFLLRVSFISHIEWPYTHAKCLCRKT